MKKLLTFAVCACLASTLPLSAQIFGSSKKVVASKNYVTKSIHVDEFNALSVGGSFDVIFTQRPGRPEVIISTSDNIIDLIDVRVEQGTLRINFKKNTNVSYKLLTVQVYGGDMNRFSMAGSGSLIIKGGLKTEQALTLSMAGSGDLEGSNIQCANLKASMAGSGDISINGVNCLSLTASMSGSGDITLKDIKATNVETSIAGSGDITLSGSADTGKYSIAGSGGITASDLKVKDLSTSISGSGGIKCFATDNLKIRVSGSGRVGYKGNPVLDVPKRNIYQLK
ncbi:MAG: DUF2807 domain-containing protein [Prevotellaceae bacterium]|nr:DUF2807 domain-containing protein [Prevotellaceae bacterium]